MTLKQEMPRAVLLELCPSRWNATAAAEFNVTAAELRPFSLRRWIYRDEFQSSFEAAKKCGLQEVVLIDQRLEDTSRRVTELFFQTMRDIVEGPSGWKALGTDIGNGMLAFTAGNGGFVRALLDPLLIAGAPIALLRGPLSSPALFMFLTSSLFGLELFLNAITSDVSPSPTSSCGYMDMGLTIMGTCVLGPVEQFVQTVITASLSAAALRMGLVGLIQERNSVLAHNIRAACALPATEEAPSSTIITTASSSSLPTSPSLSTTTTTTTTTATTNPSTATATSITEPAATSLTQSSPAPVVAVLGLAHVDGVRKLLETREATEAT